MGDQGQGIWLWDNTSKVFRRAVCDSDGKLKISDEDPFTIQQATPENLKHVPYGYHPSTGTYKPILVNYQGAQSIVNAEYDPEGFQVANSGYDYGNSTYRNLACDSVGRLLIVTYPKKVAARVYHDADQSIPNSAWTALAFNSETIDTDGHHSNVTNNPRLTCVIPGFYNADAGATFEVNATGSRGIGIKLNGTTFLKADMRNAVVGSGTQLSVAAGFNLSAGDYIEAMVYQSSGGALDVLCLSDYTPVFSFALVGSNA